MGKNSTLFISLFVALILLLSFVVTNGDEKNCDVSPSISTTQHIDGPDTVVPGNFPYTKMFTFYYYLVGGMYQGTVGAMYVNGKYYFNRWNSSLMYRYWDNGPEGGPGTRADSLPVPSTLRDLTWNGMYLYGSPASTTLYKFDTLGVLKGTFSLTGYGNIRTVAWDPNRGAFWYSDWGNTTSNYGIYCKDTANNLKGSINTNWPRSRYGLAWDSVPGGDAFLWVWNQNVVLTSTTSNGLYKFKISTGAIVDSFFFTFTPPAYQVGIAGGAEVCQIGNNMVLLLNYQNFGLQGFILRTITSVGGNVSNVPTEYGLSQNYPNPFNPSTKINFSIKKSGYTTLKIFDLTGKEVASLVDGDIDAGTHSVDFNGSKLSSGVYLYKLYTKEFTAVKKMVLIK